MKIREFISKIIRRLAIPVTVGISFLYLSTILLPYINTAKFWYLSIVGLGFPVLFFLMLGLVVFWLIMRSRWWMIICLLVIALGFQQIKVAFGFNFFSRFETERTAGTLRVMQWNVHSWNLKVPLRSTRFSRFDFRWMMEVIEDYNPDILCLEEFFESRDTGELPSATRSLEAIGYTYHYFIYPVYKYQDAYEGVAIFSRYPIRESGEVKTADHTNTDPLAYTDIEVDGQRIRIIALHLQSVQFEGDQYRQISNLKRGKGADVAESRTIVSKLKRGFQRRHVQALSVNKQIEESPYPVIVCGDFNDVPNSGTYFTITQNLQDAFLKKGSFIGRTFRFISPTLRIDYILPEKDDFTVVGAKVIHAPYSDHYPVVADLRFLK